MHKSDKMSFKGLKGLDAQIQSVLYLCHSFDMDLLSIESGDKLKSRFVCVCIHILSHGSVF